MISLSASRFKLASAILKSSSRNQITLTPEIVLHIKGNIFFGNIIQKRKVYYVIILHIIRSPPNMKIGLVLLLSVLNGVVGGFPLNLSQL